MKSKISLLILISVLILPYHALCLPEGENVVAGQAAFNRAADTLTVTTPSDKLIVDYNSFSIAQQETVNFIQPSASAVALNRVVGADPSSILGSLNATGKVFLINPNGVMFGPGARVDVPALVASTLDISNLDFLSGNYNFFKNGESAFIINQGNIQIKNGGFACLLSQALENQGIIQADLGTIVLASGEKMTLALDDLNDISVVIDEGVKEAVFGPEATKLDSAIKNSGSISANGGKVLLTAKVLNNVFDYAINNSGIIEAASLVNNKGAMELVTSGAPVYNSGEIKPFVSSDKYDYAPYEKPAISGSGFSPLTEVTVTIVSPTGEVTTLTVFTDAQGEFSLNYTPYSLTSGSYFVTSTDGVTSVLSTFTDDLGTIIINSGAIYTNNTTVTLHITADAPNGPEIIAYRLDNGPDASGGIIVPIAATISFSDDVIWIIPSGDGLKTVAVQFKLEELGWIPMGSSYIDTIILDQTPPTIIPTRTPPANIYGWNNTTVTVSYAVNDNLSGVNPNPPSDYADDVLSAEGSGQSASGIVYDNAGNWATAGVTNINIDLTPPAIDITNPTNGVTYSTAQTLLYGVTDNLSGVNTINGPLSGTLYSADGIHSVLIDATDYADNSNSASLAFTIALPLPPVSTPTIYQQDQLRYKLPYLEQFAPGQVNPFDFITSSDLYGPVYFYHPLTESDSSAFAELEAGEDAYSFIRGSLSFIGHEGLGQFFKQLVEEEEK